MQENTFIALKALAGFRGSNPLIFYIMEKATIFLGLNDQDTKTQIITTKNAVALCKSIVLRYFVGASILSNVQGVFKHDDGTIVVENSLAVILYGYSLDKVLLFVEDLKKEFNQESVTLEYCDNANINFI